MPTIPIARGRFGNPAAEQKLLWAPLYEAVLDILGSTGVIIPMGDTNHEAANRTTVTTVGEEAAVFTYSEAVSAFDTPPYSKGPGRIPIITFNGTDEQANTPDAAYWTRALAAMSMGIWVNLADATSSTLLGKNTTSGDQREWFWHLAADDKVMIMCYDEDDVATPDAAIQTVQDAALTASEGVWTFLAATYDGSANATGLNLYQDGVLMASTDTDDVNFASMRDGTSIVELGVAEFGNFLDGAVAGGPLAPFFTQVELTADAVKRLYQLGRAAGDM